MPKKNTIPAFVSGVHNNLDKEIIPKDAASASLGWITEDGRIELSRGRQSQGAEGTGGKVWEEHTGFLTDGSSQRFRKIWDGTEGKIQYLSTDGVWEDTVVGLSNAEITFTNYSSLAGNFVYAGSPTDGLFKIVTANPGSYADVYDSTKNFKGFLFIDKARSIMWGTENDKTGLYGSHIDAQDSDVYTTVSAESIGSSGTDNYTGTLAFKAGGAARSAFGITFTDGTQTITIDFTGNATPGSDGTGTVNMMTGAYDITFAVDTTGAVESDYQWEDSNVDGVTDFSKSAVRLAGEGFVVRQDAGGDDIKRVIPYEGSYFSMKANSVYQFTLDVDDTNPTNELIRTNVGIETLNGAVGTSLGIVYLDTGNPSDPRMSLLAKNPFGDNITTEILFEHFNFGDYNFSDVALENWDTFVAVAAREGNSENDTLLLCDVTAKTVDPIPYDVRCFTTDNGLLYGGSPVNTTTYELFTGFDDMGESVRNFWESGLDKFGSDILKKVKRFRVGGQISPDQAIKVYLSVDNGDFQHVGTILGSGSYVDYTSTFAVGTTMIGTATVGGDSTAPVYRFLMEIKMKTGKFRARQIKFEATGIGYANLHMFEDFDVWTYQNKLPKAYRQKQNVSVDGATVNQDNP